MGSIDSYGINDGDKVHLEMAKGDAEDELSQQGIEVVVNYKDGAIKQSLFVSPTLKFKDFRREVYGKIPVVDLAAQQFFLEDTELDTQHDEKELTECGLQNGSELRFEWRSV